MLLGLFLYHSRINFLLVHYKNWILRQVYCDDPFSSEFSTLNELFLFTEENQNTDTGAEVDNDNSCEKEGAEKDGEEERSISAPLVLSQERLDEVCRRLSSLEEKLKRLQVRGGEQRRRGGEKDLCAGGVMGPDKYGSSVERTLTRTSRISP